MTQRMVTRAFGQSVYGEHGGQLYLVRTRESVRMQEPVYKVGRTQRGLLRFRPYGNGTELYSIDFVPNVLEAERVLLDRFKRSFRAELDHGVEYFSGDVGAMTVLFRDVVEQVRAARLLQEMRVCSFAPTGAAQLVTVNA
jgi:hypothetical protein